MADYLKGLFGVKTAVPSAVNDDADFADFATATSSIPTSIPTLTNGSPVFATGGSGAVPYTKWYRVWERTSPSDFKQEAFILPFIIVLALLHSWGRRKNKSKARAWIVAHAPLLENEFASVGFKPDEQSTEGSPSELSSKRPDELLKEKTAMEYTTYATGRQNVAFVDVKLTLLKRYNPLTLLLEYITSLFIASMKAPAERVETTVYAFDGREKDLVPAAQLGEQIKGAQSIYDGFVWAIVHKDTMRTLRQDRYDISLTDTKDNAKLPSWATVMSESAEITDLLLTSELVKAVADAGEAMFENLIVTDQPVDRPQTLNETSPRKRASLSLRHPASISPVAYDTTLPLFAYLLRLPDQLVSSAHFRPEVQRRLRSTRENEIKQLQKASEEEKAEERKVEADKKKKEEREAKMRGMRPEEQRKFLDKEREKEQRKQGKKMTKKA